jgi:uracil phosphoribosyltransferase
MVRNLSEQNSLLNQFVMEIRDEQIQKDSLRFRRNLERLGEIMAYEISKELEYEVKEVTTPLGLAKVPVLKEQPVLSTILRAGLPLHQGLLNYFDQAENSFVSAFRKYSKDGSFNIQFDYMTAPSMEGKTLILSDPMLASGASMVMACKALAGKGSLKHTHIVSLIASVEGVEYVKKNLNMDKVTIWCAAIDDELTAKSYIVPGLGDAGDLAYGSKE